MQIYLAYRDGVDAARTRFVQIETTYIPSLTAGLWEMNSPRIETILDGIAKLPYVGFVEMIDEDGVRIQRNSPTKDILANNIYPLVYRDGDASYALGSLQVQLNSQRIFVELKARALGIAITSAATLMLGALLVLVLFRRWISRHLDHMAAFAETLDVTNLDRKLVLDRPTTAVKDELDTVVESINLMQSSLKEDLEIRAKIEAELQQHKNNLESLVTQRTSELEEKNLLLQLQSLELEAQNHELDAYAQSVAHDLKNPLTTLLGLSGLLKSGGQHFSPEQMQKSLETIDKTGKKMANIIDALLLLASVRRAEEVHIENIDVKALAQEAQQRLNIIAQDANAKIEFVGAWPSALGYKQWIEEVWVNYISNALKYGGVPPRVELGGELLESGVVKYWVRDYGPGIPVARRAELFLQFSRLDPTTSQGHGLGLSIVKRIIERLGGEVGYEAPDACVGAAALTDNNNPEAGCGSCFWFTLPASPDNKH